MAIVISGKGDEGDVDIGTKLGEGKLIGTCGNGVWKDGSIKALPWKGNIDSKKVTSQLTKIFWVERSYNLYPLWL